MGAWMARAGVERLGEADLIVPVPLHRFRLISRRFNQAALAHSVSQASVVPLDTQAADAAEADAAAGRAEPAPARRQCPGRFPRTGRGEAENLRNANRARR